MADELPDAPWVKQGLPDAPWVGQFDDADLRSHFRQPRPAETFEDYLKAGWQTSVPGLIKRGELPDVTVTEHTPWYGRFVAGAAQMLPDLVPGIPAALAASPTGPIGAGAAAFAVPAGIRKALMLHYERGDVKDANDFMDRALSVSWETFKGAGVGAATVASGGLARGAIGSVMLPTAVQGAARVGVPLATEAAAMTSTQAALEGRLPQPHEFLDAVLLVGAMHGGFRAVGIKLPNDVEQQHQKAAEQRLRDIYAQAGKSPQEVALEAATDPELAAHLNGTPVQGRDIGLTVMRDDVRTQLEAVGYSHDEAVMNADMMAHFFDSVSARVGADPLEIYRNYGMQIVRDKAVAEGAMAQPDSRFSFMRRLFTEDKAPIQETIDASEIKNLPAEVKKGLPAKELSRRDFITRVSAALARGALPQNLINAAVGQVAKRAMAKAVEEALPTKYIPWESIADPDGILEPRVLTAFPKAADAVLKYFEKVDPADLNPQAVGELGRAMAQPTREGKLQALFGEEGGVSFRDEAMDALSKALEKEYKIKLYSVGQDFELEALLEDHPNAMKALRKEGWIEDDPDHVAGWIFSEKADHSPGWEDVLKRELAKEGIEFHGLESSERYFQPSYHGSPYEFNKFSLQKIGTGEGAQAYSWGLYFASQKAVAEWYRDQLSGRSDVTTVYVHTDRGSHPLTTWKGPGDENPVETAYNLLTKQQYSRNEAGGWFTGQRTKRKMHSFVEDDFDGPIQYATEMEQRWGPDGDLRQQLSIDAQGYEDLWNSTAAQLKEWKRSWERGNFEFAQGNTRLMIGGEDVTRYEPRQTGSQNLSPYQMVLDYLHEAREGRSGKVELKDLNKALDDAKNDWESRNEIHARRPSDETLQDWYTPVRDILANLIKRVEMGQDPHIRIEKPGRIYTVEIPDHRTYLDWDKRMEDQEIGVLSKLRDAGVIPKSWPELNERTKLHQQFEKRWGVVRRATQINNTPMVANAFRLVAAGKGDEIVGNINLDTSRSFKETTAAELIQFLKNNRVDGDALIAAGLWDKIQAMSDQPIQYNPVQRMKGREFYEELAEKAQDPDGDWNHPLHVWSMKEGEKAPGPNAFGNEDREISPQEVASKYLNSIGIPGMRYLEGMSRQRGHGNYNYVIYDDSLVEITKMEQKAPPGWDEVPGGESLSEQGFKEIAPGVHTARGYIQFGPDRQVKIALLEKADPSTFIHESGHFYLEVLRDLVAKEDAPADLKADFQTLLDWMGNKGETITRNQHEQFARGLEAYVMEGKAPNPALAYVFEKFSQLLQALYKTLGALGVQLTPEVRGVFDGLFKGSVPRRYQGQALIENTQQALPAMGEAEGLNAVAFMMKPFAEVPQAAGEPTLPHHVNYNYLNSPEQVMQVMARISDLYEAAIQKQRRGKVPNEQTIDEAMGLMKDLLGKRMPGDPTNAADVLARKYLLTGAAEDLATKARSILALPEEMVTPQMTLEFIAAIERSAMLQSQFLGARAELGRGMQILRNTSSIADRMPDIQALVETWGNDPRLLAKMVRELDDPAQVSKFTRKAVKATSYEMLVEAFKASILSGYLTHLANVLGNTMFMMGQVPIDAVSATIGTARRALGGEGGATFADPIARMIGVGMGAMDALKVAGAVLREPGRIVDFLAADSIGPKAEQFKAAIPGVAGKIIRLPFKTLALEDMVFRTFNERGEAVMLATRQAMEEGHNPFTREFRERVMDLVENDATIKERATDAGLRYTFNRNLGEKGQALQAFIKSWKLDLIMPFVRTPGNILKEMLRMSPGAVFIKEWRQDIAAGGEKRDRALAELATGSAIMYQVWQRTLAGQITGQGDPDPNKRRVGTLAEQPYSWKIGDKWYSYQRLQPLGTLMGIAADAAEVQKHMTPDEEDRIPKMIAVAFANSITNQTFLQGLSNAIKAMDEPERSGAKFIGSYVGAIVPSLVAQPTAQLDPYQREIRGILDMIRARVPVERESLPIKHDVFGKEMKTKERGAGLVQELETPKREDGSIDKVYTEAKRLGIGTSDAPKKLHMGTNTGKIGDVKIDSATSQLYQREAGLIAKGILDEVVNDPEWDKLPDIAKKKVYTKAFMTGHKYAAAVTLPEALREDLMNEITNKFDKLMTVE